MYDTVFPKVSIGQKQSLLEFTPFANLKTSMSKNVRT